MTLVIYKISSSDPSRYFLFYCGINQIIKKKNLNKYILALNELNELYDVYVCVPGITYIL